MKQVVTKELFAYWNVQRGRRAAPERLDIDPGVIRSLLADTFILDHDPEAGFPFRIAGSRTNMLVDQELRLKSFLNLWQETDHDEITRLLQATSDGPVPVLLGASATLNGRTLDLEALLLPLRHHGRTHSRLMGAIVPLSTPDWLGLIPVGKFELKSYRIMESAARLHEMSIAESNYRNSSHLYDRRTPLNTGNPFKNHSAPRLTVVEGGR